MSGFVPEESPNLTSEAESTSRVKDQSRWNYQMFYNPAEWTVNAAGQLVPTVVHISKHPGAGLDENGDFTPVVVKLGKRGWKPIPHQVLGVGTDYVAPYRNKRGKLVCRSIFQTPYSAPDGTTQWRFDDEAWAAFIRLLRKRGQIDPPEPAIVQGILETQLQVRDRLANTRPSSDNELKLQRHEKKVAANARAIENLEAELAASIERYGAPASPARNQLLELLRGEVEDRGADVARAAAEVRNALKGGLVADDAPPSKSRKGE